MRTEPEICAWERIGPALVAVRAFHGREGLRAVIRFLAVVPETVVLADVDDPDLHWVVSCADVAEQTRILGGIDGDRE
jgi:hypothetical protein